MTSNQRPFSITHRRLPHARHRLSSKSHPVVKSTALSLLVVTATSVFVAEAIIMVVLNAIPPLSIWATVFLDATLILLLTLPALYFWLYRPMIRQIIEYKLAQENVRESERKLSFHLQNTPIAAIEWNLDFEVIEWNAAAEKVFGFKREEVLGKHGTDLIIPESVRVSFGSVWNELLENTGGYCNTNENLTKDGRVIICEWRNTPLVDESGLCDANDQVTSILSMVQDVTETKRLEELESRAARLDVAGTIAGQVAHDFNNLLAPLLAYPDFIREELHQNHPALGYLDDIENSAKKIADINQQLLTLGRRGHYNQVTLNVNTIINQAVKEMTPLADNVTFATDLDPDLMNILGGGSQIHRVITNLLCNAVDALRGIGHINIKTENYYADDVSGTYGRVPTGEYVKLTISDTGCGISDDIIKKILDPFFTTKTSDMKRGSGLGLSVVDAVVKDHNGYLDLKTSSGKGTSFYLYFPITHSLEDKDYYNEIYGGSEMILVVDDDDTQRDVSTQLLKRLGYKVKSVESGEKAIEFLRENPHDLVILDMIMPGGIDGAETYQQFLEFSPHQKAIIVSGFSESDRVQEAQELGAGAFVMKPLTRKAIAVAVREELDKQVKIVTQ